jgi:hypothetical protein
VLTDMRLGHGPSGWDVARRSRESVPTMPVVYVSGDSAGGWAARHPNSVMISKPYAFAQVVTAIPTLLNAPDQLLTNTGIPVTSPTTALPRISFGFSEVPLPLLYDKMRIVMAKISAMAGAIVGCRR